MPKTAPDPTENMKNSNYQDKTAKVNFSFDDIAIQSEIYDEDTYNYDKPNFTISKQSNEIMGNTTTSTNAPPPASSTAKKLNFKDEVLEQLKQEPIFRQELLITDADVEHEVEREKREAIQQLMPKCSVFILYTSVFFYWIISARIYTSEGFEKQVKAHSYIIFIPGLIITFLIFLKVSFESVDKTRKAYPYSRVLGLNPHVVTKKQEFYWKMQELYYSYKLTQAEQRDWLKLMKNTEYNSTVHGSEDVRKSRITSVTVRPSIKIAETMKKAEKRGKTSKFGDQDLKNELTREENAKRVHEKLIKSIDNEISRNSKIRFKKGEVDTDEGNDYLNRTNDAKKKSALIVGGNGGQGSMNRKSLPRDIV